MRTGFIPARIKTYNEKQDIPASSGGRNRFFFQREYALSLLYKRIKSLIENRSRLPDFHSVLRLYIHTVVFPDAEGFIELIKVYNHSVDAQFVDAVHIYLGGVLIVRAECGGCPAFCHTSV